jgi:molybdate transport system substrate-binding protein
MKQLLAGVLMAWSYMTGLQAGEVRVAVAANFAAPMQRIALLFEQDTGHKAVLSIGSTGNFYAQIRNGAPFDVLLAADDETPVKLEQEGWGVVGTRFTYAVGRLVLWSKRPGVVDDKGEVLRRDGFQRLAVANPKLAPYGVAALEVLNQMGLMQALSAKLVQGDNIAQTYQFVSTENAQLGFVALSQVWADGNSTQGSGWIVPAHLYTPIRQDAVLLTKGQGNRAAQALMVYLQSDKIKALIRTSGYTL